MRRQEANLRRRKAYTGKQQRGEISRISSFARRKMSASGESDSDAAANHVNECPDDYDVETLLAEIEQERQMTDMLDQSVADLKGTLLDLEEKSKNINNEGGEWKARYEAQQEINGQLQRQINQLKEKIRQNNAAKKQNANKVTNGDSIKQNINELSETGLKALVRKMEKEKISLEGQLRDLEWRLDQESKAFHKASESRKKYVTDLNQASMMLSTYERRKKLEATASTSRTSYEKRPARVKEPLKLPEIKKTGKQILPKNRLSK